MCDRRVRTAAEAEAGARSAPEATPDSSPGVDRSLVGPFPCAPLYSSIEFGGHRGGTSGRGTEERQHRQSRAAGASSAHVACGITAEHGATRTADRSAAAVESARLSRLDRSRSDALLDLCDRSALNTSLSQPPLKHPNNRRRSIEPHEATRVCATAAIAATDTQFCCRRFIRCGCCRCHTLRRCCCLLAPSSPHSRGASSHAQVANADHHARTIAHGQRRGVRGGAHSAASHAGILCARIRGRDRSVCSSPVASHPVRSAALS